MPKGIDSARSDKLQVKKTTRPPLAAARVAYLQTLFILVLLGLCLYSVNCTKKRIFKGVANL